MLDMCQIFILCRIWHQHEHWVCLLNGLSSETDPLSLCSNLNRPVRCACLGSPIVYSLTKSAFSTCETVRSLVKHTNEWKTKPKPNTRHFVAVAFKTFMQYRMRSEIRLWTVSASTKCRFCQWIDYSKSAARFKAWVTTDNSRIWQ